ncbi:hypothetical protein Tco_0116457 [Tanacetum coccineum]
MNICTILSDRVLSLENTNTSQPAEIATLKKRVKKLEKKRRSRTYKPKRLYKVGSSRRVESSEGSLGAQEDASKQGRKIADIDADAEVTLMDETQGRSDDNLMFDTNELTLAQTLIEIKAAKLKAVTTAATTVTPVSTRPKAKGIVFHDQEEQAPASIQRVSPSQPSQAKDKGKSKMVEPKKPLKKKDQIAFDEEVARNLEAQLQAELEEEERLARQKEEEANIALIESWDNTQAMMDADFQLCQQMQAKEQEQLSIEENKSYDEIQEMFDKEMKRVNNFVDMDTELVKDSGTRVQEISSKRAGTKLEQEVAKKQKFDENVEVDGDDDQEEAEMKKHMEIVLDEEEIAVDVIPLATKPPMIVKYKIVKEGRIGYFQIIRANRSSKRYSSMIQMLQSIDREDLETLWKLVKAKHGDIRPEEEYERVLWDNLKVMFEPDVESELQLLSDYYCWKEYADRDEIKD